MHTKEYNNHCIILTEKGIIFMKLPKVPYETVEYNVYNVNPLDAVIASGAGSNNDSEHDNGYVDWGDFE